VEQILNSAGDEVMLRRGWHAGGSTGFGIAKISEKHGITNAQIVRAVVQFPQVTRQETPSRWVHEKQALLMGITGVSQTLTVRVVIEYAVGQAPVSWEWSPPTAWESEADAQSGSTAHSPLTSTTSGYKVVLKKHESTGPGGCHVTYETMSFTTLDAAWAVDVARHMHRLGLANGPAPRVDEIWVSADLALQVRYHLGPSAWAVRFAHLDIDPTSAAAPIDSARLASDLLHDLHAAPQQAAWHDALGHGWWGDEPAGGWPALDDHARILTLPQR
jgi:hypothetical protein